MKLATVRYENKETPGVVKGDSFYAFSALGPGLPGDMLTFIQGYDDYKPLVQNFIATATPTCDVDQAVFLSPLKPPTIRDFVGFREHAEHAGKRFGLDPTKGLEAWEKNLQFYYSNPLSVTGSGEPIIKLEESKWFDYEFEIGFIIGKGGVNIPAEEAMSHIFGLTVFNDWSARDIQLQEAKLGMGAPKSKEYANGVGPVITTADELASHLVPGDPTRYDLATRLTRNGKLVCENNIKTIFHTFADMIAYASKNCPLHPGELFGSGTTGGGSIVEADADVPFLEHGEVVEMELEGVGTLRNVIN